VDVVVDSSTPGLETENARLHEKLKKKNSKIAELKCAIAGLNHDIDVSLPLYKEKVAEINSLKANINDLRYALDLERERSDNFDAEHTELEDLRVEIQSLKKKLTWVQVSVRPERDDIFLVMDKDGYIYSSRYDANGWSMGRDYITHYFDPSLLTMPEDEVKK
jgi:chromosome segregation ATPase